MCVCVCIKNYNKGASKYIGSVQRVPRKENKKEMHNFFTLSLQMGNPPLPLPPLPPLPNIRQILTLHIISLVEDWITHATPNMEKINCLNILTKAQCRRIWSKDSSSLLYL